jgi:hypothetical protein
MVSGIAKMETDGRLQLRPSGRWAIGVRGCEPVDIAADEVFLLEVLGERRMQRARMEQREGQWRAVFSNGRAERRAELRTGFFDQRERYAKALGRD